MVDAKMHGLLQLQVLWLLLPLASTFTKPGCRTHCGNLAVPFPFGLDSNCPIKPSFYIYCNTSINPPKAYLNLTYTYLEITQITQFQVMVKYPYLAIGCYGWPAYQIGFNTSFTIDLRSTPSTLSEDNYLTAIGCDDMVKDIYLTAIDPDDMFTFGISFSSCIAYCSNITEDKGFCDYSNKYSAGQGCCTIPIARGTNRLYASLSDLHHQWRFSKPFPCSYAFVGEKSESGFSYPFDYLENGTTFLDNNWTSTQLVLDWRIRGKNCSQAQLSHTLACQENSFCEDFDAEVGGYACRCKEGYEGNPYLTGANGCQDVDECARKSTNPCKFSCINTLGSVRCPCPKGYYGDGRKKIGCIKLPPSKLVKVLIGLASGMGILLLLALYFCTRKALRKRHYKKRREKFFKQNGGLLLEQKSKDGTIGKINFFSEKELEKATDHFNESRVLGKGGQGTVYKGMLFDGKIVAINKPKEMDENQLKEFVNEVVLLSQINHKNVVKLLGCCLETEIPLLLYGTLFDLLHDDNVEFPFSWNMRLKIATDTAWALEYLHCTSPTTIYHRDIKSSNILLGEKYIAKVSDFGISRSVLPDQTHVTTLVKGSFGYFDPEYFLLHQFTEKSDVYSFGVVLVELLTGQRPIPLTNTEGEIGLAARFLQSMETNSLDSILDVQVLKHERKEEIMVVARLAQRCLNPTGKMRPSMKQVAIELESIRNAKVESEGEMLHESRLPLLSNLEYEWTANATNATTTSSVETHPLKFDTC